MTPPELRLIDDVGGGVQIRLDADVRKRCPYVDERDKGRVTIEWTTFDDEPATIELHSLRALFDYYEDKPLGHEPWTELIAQAVGARLATPVVVRSVWRTADIECTYTVTA